MAVGFFLALFAATRMGSTYEGLDRRVIWDFGITLILVALIGAKVLLIFTDSYFYSDLTRVFSLHFLRAAGVFYGGFIAALIWAFWYLRRHDLPGWKVADTFAPAIPLGHFFGRLGCFLAGCCHGRPTDSFFGVTFSDPNCQVEHSLLNTPLYPVQLMEAAANLTLFFLLWFFYRRKSFNGQMILIYAVAYALIRFLIEFLRGDERGWVMDGYLSTSQFVALAIIPVAVGFYLYLGKKSDSS